MLFNSIEICLYFDIEALKLRKVVMRYTSAIAIITAVLLSASSFDSNVVVKSSNSANNETDLATNNSIEGLHQPATPPINLSLSARSTNNQTTAFSNTPMANATPLQNFTSEGDTVNRLEDLRQSINEIYILIRNESTINRHFLQQSNERITSYLEAMKTSVESFWSIRATDLISLALAAIAGWLTIPPVLFGTFYKPRIEAFLTLPGVFHYEKNTTFSWTHFINPAINIRNRTPRRFSIEIQIKTDKYWSIKPEARGLFPKSGLEGGRPLEGGFWVKSISLEIPGSTQGGYTFPLQPKPEDCSMEIIVYPRLRLSEFKPFPRYFGEVDLKPIKAGYRVTGR